MRCMGTASAAVDWVMEQICTSFTAHAHLRRRRSRGKGKKVNVLQRRCLTNLACAHAPQADPSAADDFPVFLYCRSSLKPGGRVPELELPQPIIAEGEGWSEVCRPGRRSEVCRPGRRSEVCRPGRRSV
eukprot:363259-Chlamydomonas_euryale.AAC.12